MVYCEDRSLEDALDEWADQFPGTDWTGLEEDHLAEEVAPIFGKYDREIDLEWMIRGFLYGWE